MQMINGTTSKRRARRKKNSFRSLRNHRRDETRKKIDKMLLHHERFSQKENLNFIISFTQRPLRQAMRKISVVFEGGKVCQISLAALLSFSRQRSRSQIMPSSSSRRFSSFHSHSHVCRLFKIFPSEVFIHEIARG